MASSFINSLNGIFAAASGSNSSSTPECEPSIDHYRFYQFSLIPAIVITLLFAMTKKRKNLMLNVFHGRPGLIFPMDSLTRSSRISYSCAFGSTAYLVYQIVLYQTYAIEYDGNRAVKSFIAIASMFIYGMVFFPLFSSLAIGSVFSYGLGMLYVWMMTGVEIFRLAECQTTAKARVLLIFRGLPSLLCLVYLSISIPIRVVIAFRKGRYFYWDDDFEETNTMEDIQASYSGHHVTKLFKKPAMKLPAEGAKAKVTRVAMDLFHRFVYKRQRGFRYPSRIISVMFISVIVVYTLTFEIMALIPPLLDLYGDAVVYYMDLTIGTDPVANETAEVSGLREILWLGWYLLHVGKICLIVSNVLATVFALFNVLHSLSSYRANLYALYRGDHSHLPPASAYSNTTHCINSIKYAGFQVGYIIWSYMLQFAILTLLSCILALVILLIINSFTDWILWLVQLLWPIVLTAVIVAVSQILLARFVFLQENGQYLALNNRSLYFNFAYFMFFYNIFLGLVSCLLRILKAMFVGIVFLSRLDNSTLPRRFEFIDPGFKAYVGYMQMEAAHTHPVVVVFTRLMLLGLQKKRERLQTRAGSQALNGAQQMEMVKREEDVKIRMKGSDGDLYLSEQQYRRSVAARFNWHVMYTLLHNPDIRVTRKGYVQMLRQARLLGVHIPVSDRQADINMDMLQQNIADAKEKMNPSSKKKEVDIYVVGEDDKLVDNDLNEVAVVGGGGNKSEEGDASSQNTDMYDVEVGEKEGKGDHSPRRREGEGREASHLLEPSGARDPPGTPVHITSIQL